MHPNINIQNTHTRATKRKTRESRFALNPSPSPTAAHLNDALHGLEDSRVHVEVSPASGAMVQCLAQRVAQGGVALIADYGHEGTKTDTLRGFKGHKVWDPLQVRIRRPVPLPVLRSFFRLHAHS